MAIPHSIIGSKDKLKQCGSLNYRAAYVYLESARASRSAPWGRGLAALVLAAYLLFCHGCHGDEDNELFAQASTGAGASRPREVISAQ